MRLRRWLVVAHLFFVAALVWPCDGPELPAAPSPPEPRRVEPIEPIDDPHVLTLDELGAQEDPLSIDGYVVSRAYHEGADSWQVRIVQPDGSGLALPTMDGSRGAGPRFGAARLLGNGRSQLVVAYSTGGAHCCFKYFIYDLGPRARLVFDGREWPIGDGFDEIEFEDLDCDGDLEFVQKSIHYDYELGLAYVSSPQPAVVFAYDPAAGRYVPANRRFKVRVLRYVPETEEAIAARMRTKEYEPYRDLMDMLYVSLHHIYAGERKRGLALLDRDCASCADSDGRSTRAALHRLLRTDPVYRYLYPARRPGS
jgi:hypothetical protein